MKSMSGAMVVPNLVVGLHSGQLQGLQVPRGDPSRSGCLEDHPI